MTVQRQICVTSDVEDVHKAMAWVLDTIEAEKIDNPTIGMMPYDHCSCPNHNADECRYQVQVSGSRWELDDDE